MLALVGVGKAQQLILPHNGYYPYPSGSQQYAGLLPLTTISQYHSQDESGQARFGYAHPGQAAVQYQDPYGNPIGSYAYYNPGWKQVQVSYTADHRDFRVLSNDLPVSPAGAEVASRLATELAVQDTPEVAAAKQAHALQWAAAAKAASAVDTTSSNSRQRRQSPTAATAAGTSTLALEGFHHAAPVSHLNDNYQSSSTPPSSSTATAAGGRGAFDFNNPSAYSAGANFGYNFAHPIGNQYPYAFPYTPGQEIQPAYPATSPTATAF